MVRFKEDFTSLLGGIDIETLESNPNTVYGLSRDLILNYFNPGWFKFGRENNGEPAISERFVLGTFIGDAITGDARDYYLDAFNQVLQTGKVWHHEYECSSPHLLRKFYQTVYPLYKHNGLVIVNSLVNEEPHDVVERKPFEAIEAVYRQLNGLITQCCNCRRVKRVDNPEVWDWVPSWVKKLPEKTSHTFCAVCSEFYKADLRRALYGD